MEIDKCTLLSCCCHFLVLRITLHRLSITGGCVLVFKSASTERQKHTIFLRISFHWTRTPELLSPTYNVYMDRQRITRSSRICTENLVLNRYKTKTSFSPQMQDKYWTEGVVELLLVLEDSTYAEDETFSQHLGTILVTSSFRAISTVRSARFPMQ